MNYYKRHVGDYAADTGHLSILEHGVYALLLDGYHKREAAPTKAEAVRWARARSPEELAAVDAVLTDFFEERDGRHYHPHVEETLAAYRAKQDANRMSGAAGGRANAKRFAPATLGVSEAHDKPNQEPETTNHQDPKNGNPAGCLSSDDGGTPGCPHQDIIGLYHDILPSNPRVKVWSRQREAHLRARWREDPKRQNLDYWRRFFEHVAASPFLTGQTSGREGRAFRPGLDWLVQPNNFAKVIEDQYHERGGA